MTKIDRDAIRTKALRQGFKDEVLPYLKSLGFKKQYPPLAAGNHAVWGNNWSRRRGEFMDEIHIMWMPLQRPQFIIEFWTDQTERMTIYDQRHFDGVPGKAFYARVPASRRKNGAEVWYGKKMSMPQALALAKENLSELDKYLKTGNSNLKIKLCASVFVWRERPSYLFRDPPPIRRRVDTWLDRLSNYLFMSAYDKKWWQELKNSAKIDRNRFLDQSIAGSSKLFGLDLGHPPA